MAPKQWFLQNAGVRLAKDGKSVFNYNPGKFSAGGNWALALTVMPMFFSPSLGYQMFALLGCMHFWIWVLANPADPFAQMMIPMCYSNVSGLAKFVLGLFVSFSISKTYYSNRGQFGTLFGRNMGFTQMVASWVKAPEDDPVALAHAQEARTLLVRWANASFRLMWLETGIYDTAEEIGKDMLDSTLLTEAEWKHISGLSSRCTHIYQWMNNVLHRLLEAGYIRDTILLNRMHGQIDDMRGANVWGLPSLPIPYVTIVTLMVKIHLVTCAFAMGAAVRNVIDQGASWWAIALPHLDLVLQNFLMQGLLDLHGLLYNPNQGLLLGHLPVCNFLAFVHNVTNALLTESCIQGTELPYTLGSLKPVDRRPKLLGAQGLQVEKPEVSKPELTECMNEPENPEFTAPEAPAVVEEDERIVLEGIHAKDEPAPSSARVRPPTAAAGDAPVPQMSPRYPTSTQVRPDSARDRPAKPTDVKDSTWFTCCSGEVPDPQHDVFPIRSREIPAESGEGTRRRVQ